MSRNDKHLAIQLRKSGKGYNFISAKLGVPKSTLSDWFATLRWSQTIKEELTAKAKIMAQKRMRLIAAANKRRWANWRNSHRAEAIGEFPKLRNNPLFIAGLMLYWGEGDSNIKNPIRLSNITPEIVRLFIKFLLHICQVPKERIKIALVIYPDLNEERCKNYWLKQTGLSTKNFYKTQVIKGRHPSKRIENGICMISVSSRGLKEKFQEWMRLSSNMILK